MTSVFFFFNDTATTEIYTLSLHDALRSLISIVRPLMALDDILLEAEEKMEKTEQVVQHEFGGVRTGKASPALVENIIDRKSTRLNSSHLVMSYAVFCLKKKTRDAEPAVT